MSEKKREKTERQRGREGENAETKSKWWTPINGADFHQLINSLPAQVASVCVSASSGDLYWKTLSSAATLVENCKIFTCYLRVNRTQLKHLKTIKAQRWKGQGRQSERERWDDEVLLQALICARVAAVPFAFSRINRALSFATDRAIKIQTNKHSLVIRHSRGHSREGLRKGNSAGYQPASHD